MTGSKRISEDRRVHKGLMRDHLLEDVHSYRVNRHARIIYVESDPNAISDGGDPSIEWEMANRLGRNLDILEGLNNKKPILIKTANYGGYWHEGRQMMDAILLCKCPITVLATKMAASMGSLFPLVADRFLLTPSAKYMYHYGYVSYEGRNGEAADSDDEERRKDNDLMIRVYVARLREQGKFKRMSEENLRAMIEGNMRSKADVWLPPHEAKSWGFVDGVYTGNEPLRTTTKNVERRKRMLEVIDAWTKFVPPKVTIPKR